MFRSSDLASPVPKNHFPMRFVHLSRSRPDLKIASGTGEAAPPVQTAFAGLPLTNWLKTDAT